MEDIIIRELVIGDIEAISEIYSGIIQDPVKPDFKELIQRHAERKEDLCFVAEVDGKVVGFMVSYILTFGIEKSAWIATLGVNPEFMGQGIGKKLGEKLFNYYKALDIENVYTSVRWDSTDLLSFFKTLGFDRSNFINLRKQI